MNQTVGQYVVSLQAEHFYKGRRYHWIICSEHNPDELVSWGYALTQQLAEAAARQEVTDLSSGLSRGGQLTNASYSGIHHC